MKHSCSRLMAAACAGFVCVTCFGQTAPLFTTEISASGPSPSHVYAVDVNNDGLTDIIQDSASPGITGSYFSVSINAGNGTFLPPVTYKINSGTWTPLTWGDFNNDGKVDIAVVLAGTNQVAVYLGNGDGTFQKPITTGVDLPSGMSLGVFTLYPSVVAADFNHDGNQDLVTAANNGNDSGGTWTIYLLPGDGAGGFSASPVAIYAPTSGWAVQGIVGGDFDTDGNADVTLQEQMWCSGGVVVCSSNIVTLFGNGDTTFDPVDVTTVVGPMTLGSADLNNDGATDLYGIELGNVGGGGYGVDPGGTRLAVFLGHYGRQFGYLYTDIPSYQDQSYFAPVAVADFNGTGNWALATLTTSAINSSGTQVMYLLNAGTSNVSIAYGPSPAGNGNYQNGMYQTGPVVGNFNGDGKPDIAINLSNGSNSPTTTLAVGVNANAAGFYGGCNYPSSGQGIHLCTPDTTGTNPNPPTTFAASANSFGQLRKMELWVDGVKLDEQHDVWGQSAYLYWTTPGVSPGNHSATIYAANIDDTLQRYDFTFTAGDQ
jgi:hypothetical protein